MIRLLFILVIWVTEQGAYCQSSQNLLSGKAWVIKDVNLKKDRGWHTVVDIMDIMDFENDSLLVVKKIGVRELKSYRYKVDQKGRLKINNGSQYQLKSLSDSSLALTDGSSVFIYTALRDTKSVISIDSAVKSILSNIWSYDSLGAEKRIEFSEDRFLVGEFDTGLQRFTETSIANGSEKYQGGWTIESYKDALLFTIFPSTSYRKTTYQVEKITDNYIKTVGWQDGLKTIIKLYKL